MMEHITLFDLIAPAYAWFYKHQTHAYQHVLNEVRKLNLDKNSKLMDIACGTGALSSVLAQDFNNVIALDGSKQMLKEAKRIHKNEDIEFSLVDLRQGIPYPDQSFDLITTAFFMHGIPSKDRIFILNEMKRVAKHVMIIDYYGQDNILIRTVEFIENGDYFNFKKDFIHEFKLCFKQNQIIPLHKNVGIYINHLIYRKTINKY